MTIARQTSKRAGEEASRSHSKLFRVSYGVVDNHPRYGFVIFFLFRRVHPMRAQIERA
jgi:hypothetical protein